MNKHTQKILETFQNDYLYHNENTIRNLETPSSTSTNTITQQEALELYKALEKFLKDKNPYRNLQEFFDKLLIS